MNTEAKRLAIALHRIKVAVGNTQLSAEETADAIERMAHRTKVLAYRVEQAMAMAKDARIAIEQLAEVVK